jgi:hypothetical protein
MLCHDVKKLHGRRLRFCRKKFVMDNSFDIRGAGQGTFDL